MINPNHRSLMFNKPTINGTTNVPQAEHKQSITTESNQTLDDIYRYKSQIKHFSTQTAKNHTQTYTLIKNTQLNQNSVQLSSDFSKVIYQTLNLRN